ncbi:protein CTR9 [Sesamum alatum]|uniref:Protein CTR9 n=1 Tax=Sesamum alatum TaxID=300844 RepID=A0AAE1XPN7_9LAMI|nr:protein CTR9 [Sesamum alatum]
MSTDISAALDAFKSARDLLKKGNEDMPLELLNIGALNLEMGDLQVLEATGRSFNVQMPDVFINLAHVHFAQGNFALAVKMYQNCLRKFYYNTESQLLLYLARAHCEAQQWQDCTKSYPRNSFKLHIKI